MGAAQADWPTLDENGNFHDVPNTVEDDFGYGGCGAGGGGGGGPIQPRYRHVVHGLWGRHSVRLLDL